MTRTRDLEGMRAQRAYEATRPEPVVTFGHWLISGKPVEQPCKCEIEWHWKTALPTVCPCYRRKILDNLGHYCCAVRRAAGAIAPALVRSS